MKGLFFARFDDVAGPIVACEAPELADGSTVLPADLFDRVSDYIIAKKELCGSVLTVTDNQGSGEKVMSCPLFVESEKNYRRNAFFFAFGLVFAPTAQTGPFQLVLRKLSSVLRSLEVESLFLSREGAEVRIKAILEHAYSELTKWGECIVSIDEASTLALKITPRLVNPPEVYDWQVPVCTRVMEDFISKEWDLTILQVMQFVDGVRHIKLIAELSGVAVALVRRCVRQLLYFRCVRLVDIFQYSNTYVCTPCLVELAESEAMQRNCTHYVWNGSGELPSVARVFQLYASLQPCLEIKDFCLLNDTAASNIDDRRLIVFGVLHGLIKRVHVVPVFAPSLPREELEVAPEAGDEDEPAAGARERYLQDVLRPRGLSTQLPAPGEAPGAPDQAAALAEAQQPLASTGATHLVDGRNTMDAICTELWASSSDVKASLSASARVVFIRRTNT